MNLGARRRLDGDQARQARQPVVRLDDPSLPAPLNARLGQTEETTFELRWLRGTRA